MPDKRVADPRFADIIRRIQAAAQNRFRYPPGTAESMEVIDREVTLDRELNDTLRGIAEPGADPPNHDPDD